MTEIREPNPSPSPEDYKKMLEAIDSMSDPVPNSAYPMTPAIAAEFITALHNNQHNEFFLKYNLVKTGAASTNWIEIAKLICAVAGAVCPIVNNL